MDEGERKCLALKVAGPTALLVAKLHKLADRRSSPHRHDDKDALDIYRLFQAVPTRSSQMAFASCSVSR
jgi:hypothetical protein